MTTIELKDEPCVKNKNLHKLWKFVHHTDFIYQSDRLSG